MDLNKFDAPFNPEDIEWRIQRSGKMHDGKVWALVLAYVTNRAIMKRLDDVCGKAGWRNEYRDIPNNGGVECGISIKIGSEWVTKWDAAENTQVEAIKGGRSGAMKRAAVQWGIGRYLY
ncbi:recombinase, partial [Salmonella enterica subsp. enterica]|nr:recombinase [Salmonella enterica subsp. enterica serovar Indiana]